MKILYSTCGIGFTLCLFWIAWAFSEVGCSKPEPPPSVPSSKGSETSIIRPFCEIDSRRKVDFTGGTGGVTLESWAIKACRVKRIAARILLIRDRTVTPVYEAEYLWENWEPADWVATGQLLTLSEDAHPENEGRSLPLLSLQIENCPTPVTQVRSSKGSGFTVKKGFVLFASGAVYDKVSRKQFLANEVYAPRGQGGGSSFSSTLESIVENSSNGRDVISLEFEWDPLE